MRAAKDFCELPRVTRSTHLQAVKFREGMVVTADDMEAAMRYPLAVFQTLVRAYFGCGILCGLEVKTGPEITREGCHGKEQPRTVVHICPGVALGCDGYPIELCAPVRMDLTPDPCCPDPPKEVCIGIRRITSDDAPREDCGCTSDLDSSRYQCTRVKDHVLIEAFPHEDLPRSICRRHPKNGKHDGCGEDQEPHDDYAGREPQSQRGDFEERHADWMKEVCACLKSCPDCDPCAENWVLLACVRLDGGKDRFIDSSERKWVKPIECLCAGKQGGGEKQVGMVQQAVREGGPPEAVREGEEEGPTATLGGAVAAREAEPAAAPEQDKRKRGSRYRKRSS